MLFFSSQTPWGMPKKNGIPKSLLADIKSVKTRLSGLERPKAILADIARVLKIHVDQLIMISKAPVGVTSTAFAIHPSSAADEESLRLGTKKYRRRACV